MRGANWLALGLGLGLGLGGMACSLDSKGLNHQGPDLGDTTAASTGTTTTDPGTTVVGLDGTASSSSTTTADTTTSAPDDTTSDGTTGPGPSPLVDTGLLARWYVDEADTGKLVTSVLDSHPPTVDLVLLYESGSPTYAEIDGNRGLSWPQVGLDGRAIVPIAGTKLLDDLGGAQQATFELVLGVKAVSGSTSRFLHFGTGNGSGDFVIGTDRMDLIELRWNDAATVRNFDAALTSDRQVLHVVVDTTQAAPEDRFRAYLDGSELVSQDMAAPVQGEGLPLQPSSSLVLGNRADGQRSFRGTLHYAAIYLAAFDASDIKANAEALLISDDAP